MIAPLTGLIAGAAHVWSGPDHLAAIAPLAAQRSRRAWLPGVRWGVGHSAGVALVGVLSLWLRDLLPVELLSTWGERLVGVLLIGIGVWAFRKAAHIRIHAHAHEHDGNRHVHIHSHNNQALALHERREGHRHTHAAFGIGILHGLAGSSHFLGVLPILAFPTRTQAAAYLLAFALGTIASMALFSSVMGRLAHRCEAGGAKVYRTLMRGCAVAAVAVGCFWLVTGFH
jgi:ABC-type nickel/cobalt efflux system permease component RcnA